MAVVTVKHNKVVTVPDDPNYPVGSDEWNDNHSVVGIENVDNTSDANKPISTAQQAALDAKVAGPAGATDDLPAIFDGTTGKLIKSKTYAAFKTLLALVKADVGLGNVANVDTTNASSLSSGTVPAARLPSVAPVYREILTANRTYFVSTTGNDANNGLTSGTPWLTPQHAWDVISLGLDLNGKTVTVQMADGTYSSASYVLLTNDGPPGLVAPSSIVFQGNAGNNTSVVFDGTLGAVVAGASVAGRGEYTLKNLRIKSASGDGLAVSGATVSFDNLDFFTCAGSHIFAQHGAFVSTGTPYTVSGNATVHANALTNAVMGLHATQITYSNAPVFTVNVNAQYGGEVFFGGITFVNGGTVTGLRFLVSQNGYIDVGGAGATYIPGAGSDVSSGGQYDTMEIGSISPKAAAFTTLAASGVFSSTNATASTSTTTGALTVAGGLGVAGAVNIGGNSKVLGLLTAGVGAFPPATTIGISSGNAKNSSTFDGFNITSNDSGATQLVAEFVMAADPTAANRRLKIDMVEQGVAWRNVSLCESGGAVAIGMTNGLVTAGYSLDAGSGLRAGGAISSTSPTAGIGYVTGAGGTVTQATSKATGVTLNKASGQITMNAAALAAGTIVSFVLTDSAIAATDVLILNHISGGTPGSYSLNARCAAGSATIDVRNNTAGSLSEAIVIQFALIKGVNA